MPSLRKYILLCPFVHVPVSKDSEAVASLTPSVVPGGSKEGSCLQWVQIFLEKKTVSTSSLHVEIETRVLLDFKFCPFL